MKQLKKFSDPTISTSRHSTIKYATGGKFKFNADDYAEADNRTWEDHVAMGEVEPTQAGAKLGFNYSQAGKDLLPYASNVVNAFRKLPKPIAPGEEQLTSPNLVNLDASRTAIDNDYRNLNAETDYKVTNPAVAQAIKATTLGKVIAGRNDVNQSEANTNAQIKNQSIQFNQGIVARNIGRKQNYNDQVVSSKIAQQNLSSDNIADIGDKYQLQQKDKSLMDLENRKLDILPTLYKDTGVYDRNYLEAGDNEKYNRKKLKKFGGAIKTK